jgi:hypothetical protein
MEDEEHIWLRPRLDLKILQLGSPFSLSLMTDYIGDTDDDFSNSGRARLLRATVRYGTVMSRVKAQLGRFYRYSGVSTGVMDGVDVSWRFAKDWRIAAFGGLLGPRSREFEVEDADHSVTVGGELRWSQHSFPVVGPSRFVISYARQEREPGVTRNVVGLSTHHRLSQSATWFNVLHLRPTDALLRKFMTRLRMRIAGWSGTAEIGMIHPNVAHYSWFSSFSEGSYHRFRLAVDRQMDTNRWAGGLEGMVLSAGGKSGFRGGPVLTSPWGQIGYRLSAGDQARGAGPWASLMANPCPDVRLYAYGALISYEWEAFEIESEELAYARGGVNYTLWFQKALQIDTEVQVYRTPQLEHDWRTLLGVSWRFDTGGAE